MNPQYLTVHENGATPVFSLGGPSADGKPELRVAVNRTLENLCASFDFPRTLSVKDGTLTFAPSQYF